MLHNVIELANRPPVSAADLEARWTSWGMPVSRSAGANDLRTVRAYLRRWTGVVDAVDEPSRVAALNGLLRRYVVGPSITDHDGSGWHLHYRDPDAAFGATLAGSTTAAAAQFLTDRGMHRLGRCALAECANAFLDVSRPGRQRYCSQPCANRDAVRRHRSRREASCG